VCAGHRALAIDFEKAQIKLDAVMHGPTLGVGFRLSFARK